MIYLSVSLVGYFIPIFFPTQYMWFDSCGRKFYPPPQGLGYTPFPPPLSINITKLMFIPKIYFYNDKTK